MVTRWAFVITVLTACAGGAFETADRSDYIFTYWDDELKRLGEPPLPALVKNDTSIFRAMHHVSWEHPVIFKVETFPDGRPARLTHSVVLGDGPSVARKKVSRRDLTPEELERFRDQFNRARICGSPLYGETEIMDGSGWTFEFANATRHCAVERDEVPQHARYNALGDLLRSFVK